MTEQLISGELGLNDCPLVSIVVPTKNRPDSLRRLLASIARQQYPRLEVVIVDDGSEVPVSVSDVNISELCLLRNEKSVGLCLARNRGIEQSRGEFIVFLDDDAEFENETTILRAVELLRKEPDCGVVGFCQLQTDGQAHYMQPANLDQRCYTSVFFGYGFMLRIEAVRQVGAFNPLIGFYYDENEFCLRLINAGYKIIYDPTLRVFHYHDARGRDSVRMHRLVLRNSIITALLHSPLWCLPPQIATRLLHFIRLSRADRQRIDWAGIRWAHHEVMTAMPSVRRERKAMRFKTLLHFRRLNREPIRLH